MAWYQIIVRHSGLNKIQLGHTLVTQSGFTEWHI